MNPFDLPFRVIVALWLYRRFTRPPVKVVGVDLYQYLLSYITMAMKGMEGRIEYRNKNAVTKALYAYIMRSISWHRSAWQGAEEAGIKNVIAVKKGDENGHGV